MARQSMRRQARQTARRCALALAPLMFLAESAVAAAPPPPTLEEMPPPVGLEEMRRQRRMSGDLYRATSSDAATFEKAMTTPAVRAELERVLKKPLDDQTLRAMATQSRAESEYWGRYKYGIEMVIGVEQPGERGRRAPGQGFAPFGPEPIVNPGAMTAPRPFERGGDIPVPDRWRILDALGRKENRYDPYNTNTLKGDKPIFGEEWFLSITATTDTIYEPSRVPVGILPNFASRPGTSNTFGRYGRTLFNHLAILEIEFFEGDTAFKPQDLEFRFTPVFNNNHLQVAETGIINANPKRGTVRDDAFLGIQAAFVDYHIRNVSEYHDFDSLRAGIQPFNTDFRGFLFQDDQLGVRLFGDREANKYQYNLAYFRRLNKDTNSGLNSVQQRFRRDDVFVANFFAQDLPVLGYTSQFVYLRNDNREGNQFYYDKNGFLVRPAQIGDNRGYDYHVNYLGYNGDGHFGRINLTTSAYYLFGSISHNQFSPNPQNKGADVNAFFFAAEPSVDFDFLRVRLSALYASGAGKPQSKAGGFDAVFENPQFAGADTSYWIRQSIPLVGGGGVALNTSNGVLADLRSAKGEGQSNFINPGLMLAGFGTDLDILPELRLSTNVNYLRFAETAPLEFLRHTQNIRNSIGYDLSAALTYRPLFSQNVILRLSGAVLLPGDGLRDLYNTKTGQGPFGSGNFLYSVLANVIVTY